MALKRDQTGAGVIWRSMGARTVGAQGITLLLDAVQVPDGRVFTFFGNGTPVSAFRPDRAGDSALPMELREVSGAALIVTDGPGALPLADGTLFAGNAGPPEPDLFEGLNTILAFRLEETAAQVAEGLIYHARHHGLQAALIFNRLPDGGADGAFCTGLAKVLGDTAIRVVVLDCPVPLGRPDMAPENHVWLAPDAPGKDRMQAPAPDPWRAPLGEQLVYELAKWRFLSAARAVLTLDVSDILAPIATSAFDACVAARQGVVLLAGRRIYPWRVKPRGKAAGEARFGDHICRQFDARRGIARWGVAPQKAGLENTWRMVRVAYAKPDGAVVPFYRAMGIRVPVSNSGALAPKTSLIEDAQLLDMAQTLFDHAPIRAPVSEAKAAPKAATKAGRTAIVTTMKNEGPFILEWLAWHRAIGVDDFLVYTNDCTDGTDTMLDLLQARGIVQHRANPWIPGGALKPQHAALQAAEAEPVMQTCGWGICMDVDEFITIKIGDGTLGTLYAAMGEANMISLTWRLFGNADVAEYRDQFITGQFTDCAPEVIRKPHQAWGFKTLFRNIDIYKKLGVHRPKGLKPDLWDRVKWLNGSGQPMPREVFRNGWRSTLETYGYDWVQLNHYAVRSAESFLVKRDRGRVNHVDRDQGLNYWFRMNHNADRDTSALRMIPKARAEFERLMRDPEIAAAHAHSVACHRDKIAALMQTDTYRAFYAELTGERMRALCRLQHHFGSAVFTAGPEVIPQDLHKTPLAPDFIFTVDPDAEAGH